MDWHRIQEMAAMHGFMTKIIVLSVLTGAAFALFGETLRARKIQPKGFRWRTFRNEAFFAMLNLSLSGVMIGALTTLARSHGLAAVMSAPAAWSQVVLEYALYFFAFDTWFYWWHRAMHREPFYRLVHKIHHYSTSPNLLTTVSESPLESLINGGFVPLFLAIVPVHATTVALIVPTNIIMGLYVHSGYEFFPRWWNKSWATKWFITATFHDQHHKYFRYNFGGYTTIWDRICGTMRPKFEADFDTRPTPRFFFASSAERETPAASSIASVR